MKLDVKNTLLSVFIICIISVITLFIKKYIDDNLPDEKVEKIEEPIKDGVPLRFVNYIGDVGSGKFSIIEIENLNIKHRYLLFDGRANSMVKISEKENILPDIK